MRPFYALSLYTILVFASACELQKDLDIDIPPAPKHLMVEAYLIPGEPVWLLLTETADYLDSIHIPYVNNARVIIKSKTATDTLENVVFFNPKDHSTTNYASKKIIPLFNETYELYIEDSTGRKVTAKTTILPIVPIDTVEVSFNANALANLTLRFLDDPQAENYYRVIFFTKNKFHSDILLDDKLSNGSYMSAHSGFRYNTKGYVDVRLFHLSKEHFQFLKSLETAEKANSNNPFAQPTRIVSGVEGGTGIFTGLSYSEKRAFID